MGELKVNVVATVPSPETEILNRDKHFKFNGNLNVQGESYLEGKVGINL